MVISPAKTLDYETVLPLQQFTQARQLEQSQELITICRTLSASQLAQLMKISDKLAQLNVERFRDWQIDHDLHLARQALFAFKGDVYTGLDVETFTPQDIGFAQQYLRILSGLYGLLRPLDLMMPYRLEMGTKLKNSFGSDLYQFWGNRITQLLQQDILAQQEHVLINLASDEYFKSVHEKSLQARVIKPVFLDQKNGAYKIISFYAKKARGLMSRFIIQNRLDQTEQLKFFNLEGYYFDETSSNRTEWVFKRDTPPH